jgi:PST family polysaccharide transporter
LLDIINIYTASNTVILGLFASNAVVGYYAAAEKIVRGIQNLQAPLSQAMYPHVSRLARQSKQAALHFIARIARIVTAITFIISVALLALAPQLSRLLLGPQFAQSVTVIRILAFLPFVVGLSNIFGVQTMLNFGLQRTFSVILTVAGILDIGLALLLVRPLHHLGIAISVLVTEIFVTVLMFVFLQRNDLKIFQLRPKLAWQ